MSTTPFSMRIREDEKKVLKAAAGRQRMSLTMFVMRAALEEAARVLRTEQHADPVPQVVLTTAAASAGDDYSPGRYHSAARFFPSLGTKLHWHKDRKQWLLEQDFEDE